MSNTILVIGESGSGKSSSIKNLPSHETCIINVLDKPLPFKGFKNNYIRIQSDERKINYLATDDTLKIRSSIKKINDERPEIKNIIIDDFQYIMANQFMRKALEKGYDKFTEIGQNAWNIIKDLTSCRDDLKCYVLSHSDSDSYGKVKCKTIGKMLDDKICLEGMFTIVFHAITNDNKYKFLTQNDGIHLAKSPLGMFNEKYIDNDLNEINKKIDEYFNEDIIK
ncbi:MAG TPA: AAA family ATPase [Buchnera sp. (in: enterobacteria)]|nr:AAA family ATPase [Buchnera sp. (in: enterobacteria)]